MIVVVMGVSGSGKTTIGKLLASELDWDFADADDFHPQANVQKMAAGIPLTDQDRAPWLQRLRQVIFERLSANQNLVLACSALKASYRELLAVDPERMLFVYLKGSYELIASRMLERKGHFMKEEMLKSQFDALEEPGGAFVVEISEEPSAIVKRIRQKLGA